MTAAVSCATSVTRAGSSEAAPACESIDTGVKKAGRRGVGRSPCASAMPRVCHAGPPQAPRRAAPAAVGAAGSRARECSGHHAGTSAGAPVGSTSGAAPEAAHAQERTTMTFPEPSEPSSAAPRDTSVAQDIAAVTQALRDDGPADTADLEARLGDRLPERDRLQKALEHAVAEGLVVQEGDDRWSAS